jgi:hypothetical protein
MAGWQGIAAVEILPPSPLPPLPDKGRGELVLFNISVKLKLVKLQKYFYRTSIYSLSLDGRGLGRGCFIHYLKLIIVWVVAFAVSMVLAFA